MKFISKLILLLILTPSILLANSAEKKHEKSRIIKKQYSVNSDAKLSIDNKYGNLNITTWNQNRVEIEVKIIVKGNDLESVEDRLSEIDVDFTANSSYVTAKTRLEKQQSGWSFWKNKDNLNYQINYTIKMPASNSVDLDNDYGNIYLDDLSGVANINCDYGKISVGKLSADNNNINLDYCSSSSIVFMKSGNVNVDYSKITVDECEGVKVNSDYSTVKFEKVNDITFNADYGAISIDDAENINGNSDYAGMRFGTVRKNLIIDTDYGSVSVKRLSAGFENVDIDGQYAGIRIGVESDAVFDFELDLQYAGFKGENDKMEFFKKIVKSSKKYYSGKFGTGNSSSKIKIRSQYGGVSITEN